MDGEERKIISIGMEDFKTIIEKNGYFVDKTQMIQQLLDSNSKVTLFTRPRRFGKTLNLSMIRRFFEDERLADGTAVDNRKLFDGLYISRCGEKYLQHQQQYPVISLSLKEAQKEEFSSSCLKDNRRFIPLWISVFYIKYNIVEVEVTTLACGQVFGDDSYVCF